MAEALKRWSVLGWIVTVGATGLLVVLSDIEVSQILMGTVALALAQLVEVPTPSGRTLDVGLAVAAAMPLLLDDPAAVGVVYAIGLLIPRFVWRRRDWTAASGGFLAATIGLAVYETMFFVVSARLEGTISSSALVDLIAVAAAGLTWFVSTTATMAIARYRSDRSATRYRWLLGLSDWPAVVGLIAAGALFGFAHEAMGVWAALMAAMAYAFSHLTFVRYHETKITYGQTIGALSRIPEVADLTSEGHSSRTALMARAIGQELGLAPTEVTELEYAALMHDIGRISLSEPAIVRAGYTDADIAGWSADIVAEAPYLTTVATIIRQQHHPYRQPGEETDESLPVASKVIKVASAYDHAVTELGLLPVEAVELLHRGAAYDFDPRMVKALRRVIAREGSIAW
jgi:HD-GYP domain-containing protein (c-di-GMP phosphodiesterase class II)